MNATWDQPGFQGEQADQGWPRAGVDQVDHAEAQQLKPVPPKSGLIVIKIDGQWKLDDWLFGTRILTDSGR